MVVSGIPFRVMRLEHSYFMEEDSVTGTMRNRHRDTFINYFKKVENITIFEQKMESLYYDTSK